MCGLEAKSFVVGGWAVALFHRERTRDHDSLGWMRSPADGCYSPLLQGARSAGWSGRRVWSRDGDTVLGGRVCRPSSAADREEQLVASSPPSSSEAPPGAWSTCSSVISLVASSLRGTPPGHRPSVAGRTTADRGASPTMAI